MLYNEVKTVIVDEECKEVGFPERMMEFYWQSNRGGRSEEDTKSQVRP